MQWKDKLTIEEVKTLKRLQQDRRFADKRRQSELFAAEFDTQYLVFTEADQGQQPLSSNLDFLSCFRFIPEQLPEFEEPLVRIVNQLPGLTVLELAAETGPSSLYRTLPCIWHLLYSGRLCADLVTTEIRKGSEYTLSIYPGNWMQVDEGPYQLPMKPSAT